MKLYTVIPNQSEIKLEVAYDDYYLNNNSVNTSLIVI